MSIVIPPAASSRIDLEHLPHELGVERARDLVEQHQVRVHRERADDGDALLLTAREPVRVLAAAVGEPEAAEQLEGPRLRLGPGAAEHRPRREGDVPQGRSCAGRG